MGAVIFGITAMAWSVSADREHREKMPEVCLANQIADMVCGTNVRLQPDRFFPSRYWSREIIEYERERKAREDSL